MYRLSILFFLAVATSCLLVVFRARAGDPLDDVSGTEEWDQVVPPARGTVSEPVRRDDFRQQVEEWNVVRILWHDERESFIQERTRLGRVMAPKVPAEARPSAPPPRAQPAEDWGDQPGDSWSASPGIDRVIDEELGEAKAAPALKAPPPVTAVPAPALPAEPSAEHLSSFRGAHDVEVPSSEPAADSSLVVRAAAIEVWHCQSVPPSTLKNTAPE